jgi:glutamyl-tRNA reductase
MTKNQNDHVQPEQNSVIWETCLRKIIFSEKTQNANSNLEFYKDEQALIFILEILCGLQSKVIGETEIFGQFKKFLESVEGQQVLFFRNQQLRQFLLKEVKDIREKHINKLGTNSYGSLIRKKCQHEKSISLIGFGQLAKKILPWVSDHRDVRIHVRNLSKYENNEKLNLQDLNQSEFNSTLIIAAPIEAKLLIKKIKNLPNIHKVIDCRGLDAEFKSLKGQINSSVELVELSDLFSILENQQDNMKKFIPIVKKEIKERAEAFYMKLYHRPLGWEDLCG